MGTYLLAYTGGTPPQTEEEGAAVMAAWTAWFMAIGEVVVSPGNPFGSSAGIASDGTVSTAGPSGLTGYSVLQADGLAAATELAASCPHLSAGGAIEVYEMHEVM